MNFVPLISKILIKYFLIWKLHSLLLSWMHEGCSLSTGNNKSTCFRLWFSYFSRAFTFLRSCHVSFFLFYCGRPQLTEKGIVWAQCYWNGTLTPCSPSKIFWNSTSVASISLLPETQVYIVLNLTSTHYVMNLTPLPQFAVMMDANFRKLAMVTF